MSTSDPHLIATFPNAGSTVVGEAVRLLNAQGFETVQPPMYGPDSGGGVVRKRDVEVELIWFLEAGLSVRCRNRTFEKERNDVLRLLRSLGPSR